MTSFKPSQVDDFGNPIITLDAPKDDDHKPVIVVSPAPTGWLTWVTSCGDDPNPTPPESGRGTGTSLKLSFDGYGEQSVSLGFNEPVELHDGQVFYKPVDNWSNEDTFSFKISMPSTTVTSNDGYGNCNLVNLGGYNLIVPAAMDEDGYFTGSHDVDLAAASPVPGSSAGYWALDKPTGVINFSSKPGQDSWHLFDVPISVYIIRNVMMGNPAGTFDIDAYKTEYFHPTWTVTFSVDKVSDGPGEVGGWLFMFRQNVT